ncbi:MAG: hypothetical protein IPF70_16280 [Saprospiraceae bacterium]|nr:hypothetical protein [Saprospiraceae bacterium]
MRFKTLMIILPDRLTGVASTQAKSPVSVLYIWMNPQVWQIFLPLGRKMDAYQIMFVAQYAKKVVQSSQKSDKINPMLRFLSRHY